MMAQGGDSSDGDEGQEAADLLELRGIQSTGFSKKERAVQPHPPQPSFPLLHPFGCKRRLFGVDSRRTFFWGRDDVLHCKPTSPYRVPSSRIFGGLAEVMEQGGRGHGCQGRHGRIGSAPRTHNELENWKLENRPVPLSQFSNFPISNGRGSGITPPARTSFPCCAGWSSPPPLRWRCRRCSFRIRFPP